VPLVGTQVCGFNEGSSPQLDLSTLDGDMNCKLHKRRSPTLSFELDPPSAMFDSAGVAEPNLPDYHVCLLVGAGWTCLIGKA
jgi:hypothetical protein